MKMNTVIRYEFSTAGSAISKRSAARATHFIARDRGASRGALAEQPRRAKEQDDDQEGEAHQLLHRRREKDRTERLRHRDEQPSDERADQAAHSADDHD